MSSKERSGHPPNNISWQSIYRITGLQSQTTLPRSPSAPKPGVLQPEPAVGDEPLSGYRLFDIRPLVKFVEQFPCPTCQHSGYDVTEFHAGLATTVLFLHAGHVVLSST